jgi:hypothetical protein
MTDYHFSEQAEDSVKGVPVPSSAPHFPSVTVTLVGADGNSFAILARVRNALRYAGASEADVQEFLIDAMSGDRDHLLRTVMAWVTCD